MNGEERDVDQEDGEDADDDRFEFVMDLRELFVLHKALQRHRSGG